eukprot:3036716-Pleurochrysis_carterae.AAC.2
MLASYTSTTNYFSFSIAAVAAVRSCHFLRIGGSWRLVDYGSVQETGALVVPPYTSDYVSPEVAAGLRDGHPIAITPAADTWSLGLVLYELFAREPLISACDVGEARLVGGGGGGRSGG